MSFFELNDIKRDRLPYKTDSLWHLPLWSPSITNNMENNFKKAAICTTMAAALVEPVNHVWHSMKTLNLVYEWPRDSQQWTIFMKETFRVPFFWGELRKKVVFGSIQYSFDYGMRFAAFQKIWGGTWSPIAFSDFNNFKNIFFSYLTAGLVSWVGIPFEVARKAYYADQTWPAELKKGYRSPLHALVRIPFHEGPLFLFKGGLPTYLGNLHFTGMTFIMYTWLKNKAFFLWIYNDIPYSWVKFWCLNLGFAWGSFFGYPFYFLRTMMEDWPKERGGRCTFQGSYWNAAKFLRQNFDTYSTLFFDGYWRWFRTRGIIFYLAMWQADNMGIFTNYKTDFNTIYNTVSHTESD